MNDKQLMENKNLLEKAKELAERENLDHIYKEIGELRRNWHFSRDDDESFYEKELQDKFDDYLNKIYSKLKETSASVEDKKKELISKAKELVNSNNFKKSSPVMKQLLDEWKLVGHAAKDVEETLWEEFNTIRNDFYTKRQEYYDNLTKQYAENEKAKESLIEKAIEANNINDIPLLSKTMNDLMAEWKKIKSATKEKDDELWKKFSAQRQIFFDKRNSYNEQMKSVYAERTEKKKELITEARRCLALSEFTPEEIQKVEDIRNKWKEIGSAGRDNENTLWNEFSAIIKKYLDNKKYYG